MPKQKGKPEFKFTIHKGFKVEDHFGSCKFNWAILGDCHGIAFMDRSSNDPHQLIVLLTEDDENWYRSPAPSFSSYWLPELQELFIEANKFAEKYLYPDEDADERVWGWTRVNPMLDEPTKPKPKIRKSK